jgi:ubiquinone/menaquinone biosynthesis C-methylase UbiE
MFKNFLLKIYTSPLLTREKANSYQLKARNVEWNAIKPFIQNKGKFLDVGCGAGYSMKRAADDCSSIVYGIDPDPLEHGVGRAGSNFTVGVHKIHKGVAESIPFDSKTFDTVYSSHVLEHVNSEIDSLKEMKRVLKDDGVLIIGMPTASMAYINWITQLLFTTHIKLSSILFYKIFNMGKYKWWEIFIPVSHSFPDRSLLYDVRHYRVKNWSSIISKEFKIQQTILPALYPYPEYRQLFKLKKNHNFSSSVFFICSK